MLSQQVLATGLRVEPVTEPVAFKLAYDVPVADWLRGYCRSRAASSANCNWTSNHECKADFPLKAETIAKVLTYETCLKVCLKAAPLLYGPHSKSGCRRGATCLKVLVSLLCLKAPKKVELQKS